MDKIYSQLIEVGTCWEWQGRRQKYGHGLVWLTGMTQSVYKAVYEDLIGEVPEGLELDHTCRNPPCCNPWHLEPVTHAENMRRGAQSFEARSVCLKGRHELTAESVITRRADGRQQCRICKNEGQRAKRRGL